MTWTEVGAGCFARRYEPFDVTIGAVVGSDAVLVIDTRATSTQGAQLRDDLRSLTPKAVRWVVNTHWHFDHCFGNAEFGREADIWAHDTVPTMLTEHADTVRTWLAGRSPEWAADMASLVLAPPTQTVTTRTTIDLGDREAELIHPGRAHTDGDLVIRIEDADVLYAGDLIEESGPPAFGDDSFPLDWADALDLIGGLMSERTAVVPGHGDIVDRAFVRSQRDAIAQVAATITALADARVSLDDALRHPDWPYPADGLTDAIRRGYRSLGAK